MRFTIAYTKDSDDIVSQLDFITEPYSKPQVALFDEVLHSLNDNKELFVSEVTSTSPQGDVAC